MSWNYRIMDHGSFIGLHEVYYDKDGNPSAYTVEFADFGCDPEEGVESLKKSVERALSAFEKPVLTLSDFEKGDKHGQRKRT